MLFGVVIGPSIGQAEKEILSQLEWIDAVEFRLDLFTDLDLTSLRVLVKKIPIPSLFTLRRKDQGGGYAQSEEKRLKLIEELCGLQPEFFDLEYDIDPFFRKKLFISYPKVRFIVSYHNFAQFPQLDSLIQILFTPYAHFYKIAVHCSSSIEALQLLLLSKQYPNLVAIGLGKGAQFTRLMAPILDMPFAYVPLSCPIALGQLTLQEMQFYRFSNLNPITAIYALLGDPIDMSLSPIVHNAVFAAQKQNAVYCKVPCKQEELPKVLRLLQQLPFKGLSITMPLKEKAGLITSSKTPVNTVVIDQRITSFNTDGLAAVQALEKRISLCNKQVVLVGAGGVAQSIAQAAIERGALVTCINRTAERAIQLAKLYKCKGGGVELFPHTYDVLINCTPNPDFIPSNWIFPNSIAMDTVYQPHWTRFLQKALHKNCRIIFGKELFIKQAIQQQKIWGSAFSEVELEQIMMQAIRF
jgi:3-dehydroquinate dehydratase / shikimate dehydrogenase